MRKPSEFANFPHLLHPGYGPFIAVARPDIRHDDGDTVVFFLDRAMNDYPFLPIRFWGIDAPEVNAPGPEGEQARDHLLSTYLPLNTHCTIYTEKDPDRWGRYVGAIFVLRDGRPKCVNVLMVLDGRATGRDDWGWREVMALAGKVETHFATTGRMLGSWS